MIIVIVGFTVAALGVLIAVAAILVEHMRDKGRYCIRPRPGLRAELAALWERLATFELPAPPAPAPAPRRPVNGRNLGTLPRREPITNRQPWQTAQNPMLRDQPVVPRYAPEAVYGEACQLDVAEAERHFAALDEALRYFAPDGCEET